MRQTTHAQDRGIIKFPAMQKIPMPQFPFVTLLGEQLLTPALWVTF